jgi:mono/diheme cytochrome c family protein
MSVFRNIARFFLSGRWLTWTGALVVLVLVVAGAYLAIRLSDDVPVSGEGDVIDHFKYGSTGGERGYHLQFGFGVPYWIWIALPEIFSNHLPDGKAGQGYSALGMVYEDGKDPRFDLPIGLSMRRKQGIDRVYFTCSVCHTGTWRESPGGARHIVLGMPSNTVDFGGVAEFLRQSANDFRFQPSYMMPVIRQLEAARQRAHPTASGYRPKAFGLVDRLLFQYVGVSLMREQLLTLMGRLSFVNFRAWGPGRVDTFEPPKALLGFRMNEVPEKERLGIVDFPSIWHQKARKGMRLHWDGNNCSVDERNLSAGFGTGATPATLDRDRLLRIADWLWTDATPPAMPAEHVNQTLAAQGEPIYREYCQSCHGTRQPPFRQLGDGSKVGEVTPLEEIQTDRYRLDSYTPDLAQAQNSLYAGSPAAGEEACREYIENVCNPTQDDAKYRELRNRCYPSRFSHFRKTYGYANMPLDGIWLRAPYLHNGSVPTLRALLEPKERRPTVLYIGYDVYDFNDVGFVTSGPDAERRGWRLDTTTPANGNGGHEGYEYGTDLRSDEKNALLEYLKTF